MIIKYYVPSGLVSWVPHVIDQFQSDASYKHVDVCFQRTEDPAEANFIWIHKMNKVTRSMARDTNKLVIGGAGLSGTEVLENKLWLAYLEKSLTEGVALKTQVLRSSEEACTWCTEHYQDIDNEDKVWMLKEAGGNCGEGLYVLTSHNKDVVLRKIRALTTNNKAIGLLSRKIKSYVAQEYVATPLLWEGTHKFHIRVYLVLRGNGECFMFSKALAHIANKPFKIEKEDQEADTEVHITNVAMNHHNKVLFHGCPVVDFLNLRKMNKYRPATVNVPDSDDGPNAKDFLPKNTTASLVELFSRYISKAYDNFMSSQMGEDDFVHIGADVIFDHTGKPYILEFNIPPCTGMYGEKMEPTMEELFRKMFCSIVDNFVVGKFVDMNTNESHLSRYATWITVTEKSDKFTQATLSNIGKNMLRWGLYKRRLEKKQYNKNQIEC